MCEAALPTLRALGVGAPKLSTETVLDWLTPLDKDFGPFQIVLESASMRDGNEAELDITSFSLEGLGLHGKVTVDIPGLGLQEVPINLFCDVSKEIDCADCDVTLQDINFDSNDHSEEAGAGGGSPFSGCACGAPVDAMSEAARKVVDMDELGSWVSSEVSKAISQQLRNSLSCKSCSIQ
mmetsp:Transcript_29194/g.82879  ORF Transcript_29194/g.82879 Transcript_29194/m.82879 type:complete len:180 (-) Transcript_29194:153-692(-)